MLNNTFHTFRTRQQCQQAGLLQQAVTQRANLYISQLTLRRRRKQAKVHQRTRQQAGLFQHTRASCFQQDRQHLQEGKDESVTDRKDETVNDTNYWKILPNFVTSSGNKLRTYFWRNFPRILNRSSNGESRFVVQHSDIQKCFFSLSGAGLLGAGQAWTFSVGGPGGEIRESTKPTHQNVSAETERHS